MKRIEIARVIRSKNAGPSSSSESTRSSPCFRCTAKISAPGSEPGSRAQRCARA